MSPLGDILLSADPAVEPFFAVLDGAQFDDLPGALRAGEFVARALYLDRGENNPDQVITAPHLVWLDETPVNPGLRAPAFTVPPLLELIGDRPAAVFWQCPGGGDRLFRHLRGINMIAIPALGAGAGGAGTDTVLFRHADANAMSQIAPVLRPEQTARLLGPATRLVCVPDEDWRGEEAVLTLARPDPVPPVPLGLLTLDAAQMAQMETLRAAGTARRMRGYLRRHLPAEMRDMPEAQIDMIVARSRKSGNAFGLRSAGAHQRWAWLMAVTEGRVADDPEMRAFLADPDATPDEQVREAMRGTVALLKQAAAERGA